MAIGNEDNLVSLADRTIEEQRDIARMGGIASGEARRRKRTLKEELLLLLEEENNQKNVTVALIKKALTGDTKAFEVLRDTIGEKPKDVIDNNFSINSPVNELIESIESIKNANQ